MTAKDLNFHLGTLKIYISTINKSFFYWRLCTDIITKIKTNTAGILTTSDLNANLQERFCYHITLPMIRLAQILTTWPEYKFLSQVA
jgi:hypothetical protein